MFERVRERSFGFALVVGLVGCSGGEFREPDFGSGGAPSNGTGGAAPGAGSGGVLPLPDGTDASALLPARIRRLTNAEYAASVSALARPSGSPVEGFAPDARQDGFTVNDAQRVDPVVVKQLAQSAEKLAAHVRTKLDEFAPCANMGQAEACAGEFIGKFGAQAYRRPLEAVERDGLLAVYRVGAEGATYADGIELVVRAVLQSAGFLYLTELGGATSASGLVSLTPYELASSLSYLLTAGPPDAELVSAALAGKLASAEGREAEARRLLEGSGGSERVIRVLREWLGIDRIDQTSKDATVYREFAELRPVMQRESIEFLASVLKGSTGSVGEILSADWSVLPEAKLADFYGVGAGSKASLPNRRGILNQGAFLSVYAHATESAPVLRGVAVARRIACLPVPSPTSLDIVVVPPAPDPSKTTRERFVIHAADPKCSSCHQRIDPFGFAFEQFDGQGKFRTQDSNKPVDSKVTVALGMDFDGTYANSNALAVALGQSATVRQCFARHAFRASAGRSGQAAAASEEEFLKYWIKLPAEQQGDVLETLVAFVKSPLFVHRRAQ